MTDKILVDIHEDPKIIRLLEKNNVLFEVKSLPIGDYWIGNDLIIERKSIQDMVSSSYGHLQEQIANMKNNEQHFKQIVIAVIGAYDDLFWMRFKANENSYYGMLSSVTMKYKVSQIHFKRPLQFIKYLKYCLDKSDADIVEFAKIKRLEFKDNTKLSLLCALPRVSQQKARMIIEKFEPKLVFLNKSGEKVSNENLKTEILSMKGMGKKFFANIEEHLW